MQQDQLQEAEKSLQTYLALDDQKKQPDAQSRGRVQALLLLSQLAEKRKNFAGAEK